MAEFGHDHPREGLLRNMRIILIIEAHLKIRTEFCVGGVELLDLVLSEADDPASGEGLRRELLYESSS